MKVFFLYKNFFSAFKKKKKNLLINLYDSEYSDFINNDYIYIYIYIYI